MAGSEKRRGAGRSSFESAGPRKKAALGQSQYERVPDGYARGWGAIAGTVLFGTLGSMVYFLTGIYFWYPGDLLWGSLVGGFVIGAWRLPVWVDKLTRRGWWPF